MAEKPIIFNDAMVRAILAGRKSQTRRPITPQPPGHRFIVTGPINNEWWLHDETIDPLDGKSISSPFVAPGDVLWVRECWADVNTESGPSLCYRADKAVVTWQEFSTTFGPNYGAGPSMDYDAYPGDYSMWWSDLLRGEPGHGWRPSIHMPRWACRITLPVVRVWVERVQEISPDDIAAEGFPPDTSPPHDGARLTSAGRRMVFAEVWDSIYAKAGFGWDVNPWVWCCEFRRQDNG